jgi:hypothetical protein
LIAAFPSIAFCALATGPDSLIWPRGDGSIWLQWWPVRLSL